MKISMRMYRRENGIYYYEIERNKRRSLKTKDPKEARRLYKIIKREVLRGRLAELDGDARITLTEFAEEFFDRHSDIDEDTRSAYGLGIRLLSDSIGGATLLSRVDEAQLRKFKSDCLARGCKKVSVNTYLRHIRAVLYRAHDWGYLKQKPRLEFFRLPKRHPRILAPDEVDLLLVHSAHCHPQMHRVIKFSLWTGARRQEIHSLTWQRVSDTSCRLIGKGDKERTIPLLPAAREALGPIKDIGPVFWQPYVDQYSKAFKRLARDCEIEDIHFHNLRHTAATQMLASGVDIVHVKEMLGHADLSTTQIYAQVLQEVLAREIQKLHY